MKTVVGVDLAGHFWPALAMCLDLEFPNQEFILAHAVEPIPIMAGPMPGALFDDYRWIDEMRSAGENAVGKAEAMVCKNHFKSFSTVQDGHPADTLIRISDNEHADLVVLGSSQRSGIAGFVAGSVGRALTIGSHHSLLVTKQTDAPKKPFRAIFATDHSEYAKRALQHLIQWAPKGLARIDVFSAYEVDEALVFATPRTVVNPTEMIEKEVRERLQALNQTDSDALRAAGYESDPFVVRGYANEAITSAMNAGSYSLLIMGAQGHGFLERMLVGSTAMHQVVTQPYPVLVIRP